MHKQDFNFILKKLNSRLAGWKGHLLNKVGRVALANSVLSCFPSYPMHRLWLLKSICETIDYMVHNFIWKKNTNTYKGWSLVKLDHVTQPKKLRGLGVHMACWSYIAIIGGWFGIC